ncbi:sulfatase-like hydrolase/transferase [Stieleria sp. JC731]|uniref:sulfatase-like hydrolase/transferase n=1 Tax=Pirellulaceae TaxID=2691357 RepID=UPI001E41DC19|nr:sulfatase-like hydrolase/transferase [Stieleria sp. JC731]MCC9601773.1 sulfatase-like hydrolase/transferase [Stieleria sp. JC731]
MNPSPRTLPLHSLLFITIATSAITAFVMPSTRASADSQSRPNILLILADDLGYSDLGCYGSEIQTPNIDSLAQQGVRFTQFYNTGRCWPTRGSLMTGFYAQQIRRDYLPGVTSGGKGTRPDWAQLLPTMLAPYGYKSYHTGKWHIDGAPLDNGFDKSSLNQVGRYFSPLPGKSGRNGEPLQFRDDFYLTNAMADDAIANLREHDQENPDQPFFQYLAFTAPHFPLHALPEDIAVYSETYKVGWDVIRNQRFERLKSLGLIDTSAAGRPSAVERQLGPPYHFPDAFEILGDGEVNKPIAWEKLTAAQKEFQATKMSIHAAMIHRMDIEIGRVLQQVRAMDQWENTIVLFLSDNGASAEIMVRGDGHDPNASPGSGHSYLCLGPGWSTACNTPFRRHKTWTHEGGISTPFVVSWPARLAQHGGQVRTSVQHVIDVVPTLLEIATHAISDEPLHENQATNLNIPPFPGESFASQLGTGTEQSEESRTLWWYHDAHRAIRVGNWKAVSPKDEPWELYDLSNDRIEQTDLAIVHSDKLDELRSTWETMTAEMQQLATRDLTAQQLNKSKDAKHTSDKMLEAQAAAHPRRTQQILGGQVLRIADRHAFLITPSQHDESSSNKPWVFYAPTLSRYPDTNESWMFQRLLDAGVSIAGIDVGEAHGSPQSERPFDEFYEDMVRRGYSPKPALLGRSRGGLHVCRFAIEHPDRVSAIGGIYPVFDYTTYPGVERAASAYGVTAAELSEQQTKYNPIKQAQKLAKAKIPVFLVHGTQDSVVPIEQNSEALLEAYAKSGNADYITLKRIEGQGHNLYPGFFRDDELTQFLIDGAKGQLESDK